ncbi:MAG: hypothetical protein JWQ73_1643, partial [Variovorax sp.]|nr:hypothetical protein [Variovorax sp.]
MPPRQPSADSSSAARLHVAVVGSGPAGMVLALELAEQGCRVTLIESGFEAHSAEAQSLSDAEVATSQTQTPMEDAVHRRFGGTSHLWGGRCVPYDPIDFEPRPAVRSAHWPMPADALQPYWSRACAHADCGEAEFDYATAVNGAASGPLVPRFVEGEVLSSHLERWSAEPVLVHRLGAAIRQQPLIECVLGATVVKMVAGERPGTVAALELRRSDGSADPLSHIAADRFVLACGGVETTRLLLLAQQAGDVPLDGAEHLGRYYMGHLSGKIASVQLRGDPKKTHYGFERSGGYYVRRRFTVAESALRARKLLNIALWLDNPSPVDPAHGSGILSAAYIGLRTPVLRDKLAAPAIRKIVLGQFAQPSFARHVGNLLRSPIGTAAFVARFLHGRYFAKPRLPGFFVHSPGNRYAIHYHAEQTPQADSRITLSSTRDSLGLPRARIDLRFHRADAESVVAVHALLDAHLREHDVGELTYHYPEAERVDAVLRHARDGVHQIGSTRMGRTAAEGVADAYGRIFGTDNLYACSSS